MNRLFYFALFLIISVSAVKAQKPITLTSDSVKFGSRYYPGFWLSIPEVSAADVKSNWIKEIEKGTKSKVSAVDNEMTLFGANIPGFKNGSSNIESKIAWHDSVTKLFVSVETVRDVFVNVNSEDYKALNTFLMDFARDQYMNKAKNQLAAEESILNELEKQNKNAGKSQEKMEKKIQSANIKIKNQNDNINRFNMELNTLDIRIGNTSSSLSVLEAGDSKKAIESDLKELQKQKKKLLKSINSAQSTISKEQKNISNYNKEIDSQKDTQSDLGNKIAQQKKVVAFYTQKLKTIKSY